MMIAAQNLKPVCKTKVHWKPGSRSLYPTVDKVSSETCTKLDVGTEECMGHGMKCSNHQRETR